MQEFARNGLPYEICGILSGKLNEVKTLWPLEVRIKHPYRFFVDREQVEEVLNHIEQIGEEVLVIYHSHPTAKAIPSTIDIQNHPDPSVLMGIISLQDLVEPVRFFQIKNQHYLPIPISID